jgi:hypothetical protein
MANFWQKVKNFFVSGWRALTHAGRIILGILLICIIVLGGLILRHNRESSDADRAPEVAQTYEPSIGTPLPPDVQNVAVTATVAGDSTTEPSTPQSADIKVAPKTGIDPSEPIEYHNDELKFSAVIPVGSTVDEQVSYINFYSANGKWEYSVSVQKAGTENLASIASQLHNSSGSSQIELGKLGNFDGVKFLSTDYRTGFALFAHDRIYYLLGNQEYFSSFRPI